MFDYITKWQDAIFTKATAESALHHLAAEVKELQAEFFSKDRVKQRRSEFADCFLLLFGAAHKDGMSYNDICEAIHEKMLVNMNRQWGEPNEKGYVEHIKTEGQ